MSYRLDRQDSVPDGIRRIAHEQIDKALAEIRDSDVGPHETVHQVRKRCKKIRGLLRLVRPCMEETYRRENAWYRDAAKELSELRDAHSMIGTFETLLQTFDAQIVDEEMQVIATRLVDRRSLMMRHGAGVEERLDDVRQRLLEGRRRVEDWSFDEKGFGAVRAGMAKTYRRGRKAMKRALSEPTVEHFHEWRKRVKYHWYHTRLLQNVWEAPQHARAEEVHRLSNHLGDDHDLAVLAGTLHDEPDAFGNTRTTQAALGLISSRQSELRFRARTLGERVFAEKKKALTSRMETIWSAWSTEAKKTVPQPA